MAWFFQPLLPAAADLDAGLNTDGYVKYYTGSAWSLKPIKVWTGSQWSIKPAKFWDGSQWLISTSPP